jgi:hypothetical protein
MAYRFDELADAETFLRSRGYTQCGAKHWSRGSFDAYIKEQKNGRFVVEIS